MRRETVPPPPPKLQAFVTQPGPQRALNFLYHVHIVYLLCIYSLPCPPFACVPPSGTQMRHGHSHMIASGVVVGTLMSEHGCGQCGAVPLNEGKGEVVRVDGA